MTPEEKSLLERTYKLAEENNAMLRSIRRSTRFTAIMRGLYWVLILILSFGAFYFIQPYVENVLNLYSELGGGFKGNTTSAQQISESLQDFFK